MVRVVVTVIEAPAGVWVAAGPLPASMRMALGAAVSSARVMPLRTIPDPSWKRIRVSAESMASREYSPALAKP